MTGAIRHPKVNSIARWAAIGQYTHRAVISHCVGGSGRTAAPHRLHQHRKSHRRTKYSARERVCGPNRFGIKCASPRGTAGCRESRALRDQRLFGASDRVRLRTRLPCLEPFSCTSGTAGEGQRAGIGGGRNADGIIRSGFWSIPGFQNHTIQPESGIAFEHLECIGRPRQTAFAQRDRADANFPFSHPADRSIVNADDLSALECAAPWLQSRRYPCHPAVVAVQTVWFGHTTHPVRRSFIGSAASASGRGLRRDDILPAVVGCRYRAVQIDSRRDLATNICLRQSL
jgi:hypothetical protein